MKRRIRERMCTSKVRYRDERKVRPLLDLLERAGFHMHSYRCRRCGSVHLATVKEAPE
jgi:hypothetical protein